jgi:hypothetical protein
MFHLPVLADDAIATVMLQDTTRVQGRATQPQPLTPDGKGLIAAAGDVYTAPTAYLDVRSRFWDFAIGGSGTFSWNDLELAWQKTDPSQPVAYSGGFASIGWHDRHWTVVASEYGAYSTQFTPTFCYGQAVPSSTATGSPTAPTSAQGYTIGNITLPACGNNALRGGMLGTTQPGQTPQAGQMGPTTAGTGKSSSTCRQKPPADGSQPTDAEVSECPSAFPTQYTKYISSISTLNVFGPVGRHANLSISGGYRLNDGIDTYTRVVMPNQYGPIAGIGVGSELSRTTSIALRLDGSDTFTTGLCPPPTNGPPPTTVLICHTVIPLMSGTAVAHQALSRTESADVALGVSGSILRTSQTDFREDLVILPTLTVSYTDNYDTKGATHLTVSGVLAPGVDPITGQLSNRLTLNGTWVKRVLPRVILAGMASYVQSIPAFFGNFRDPFPITYVLAGLEARFVLSKEVNLVVGEQNFWETQAGGQLASEIGYITLEARTLPLRF